MIILITGMSGTGKSSVIAELLARGHHAHDLDTAEWSEWTTADPADSLGLTTRERDVLRLVSAGRTNRQIAEELFISPKTASVHVSNILGKLGVSGRGEAAAVAHRLGLFPAETLTSGTSG